MELGLGGHCVSTPGYREEWGLKLENVSGVGQCCYEFSKDMRVSETAGVTPEA
jgi:hypothetical protein